MAFMGGLAAGLTVSVIALVAAGVQSTPSPGPLPPSALPLRLIGIVFDQDKPEKSTCLIRCGGQPERRGMFSLGERVCDLAAIREVRQDVVVIENLEANRLELLMLSGVNAPVASQPAAADPVRAVAPTSEAVPVANLPELLTSALAVPRYREAESGQRLIEGFEVTQVRPSGAAERLGLRTGDVILEVNGQVLDGMATVMRLFGELQALPEVKVTVLRDGQRMNVIFSTK